jgi:hypothetical protein
MQHYQLCTVDYTIFSVQWFDKHTEVYSTYYKNFSMKNTYIFSSSKGFANHVLKLTALYSFFGARSHGSLRHSFAVAIKATSQPVMRLSTAPINHHMDHCLSHRLLYLAVSPIHSLQDLHSLLSLYIAWRNFLWRAGSGWWRSGWWKRHPIALLFVVGPHEGVGGGVLSVSSDDCLSQYYS